MTFDTETLYVWVYLNDQTEPTLCGRCTRSVAASGQHKGTFVYQKSYLENPSALSIDPVLLPLKSSNFETTLLNGHFSVLMDAGPDSWGRREINQLLGAQTDLGYLQHGAGDQVGALAFSQAPTQPPATTGFDGFPSTTLEYLLELADLLENDEPIPEKYKALLRVGTSAGGARPKATLLHEGRQWLAKFPSKKDPGDLPSNPKLEKSALDLAELAGLNVPERKLIHVAGKDVLLVERFDRKHLQHGWSRKRYASARTVFYSKPELQQYVISGSYQRLSLEMAVWSGQAKSDRLELFKRIAFNCLINNLDDHDRNHGLLDSGNGFSLSPLFDVVPQRPAGARPRLALNLGEFGGAASKENLLSECDRFGLQREEADSIIESVKSVVNANWEQCLIKNGASNAGIERIAPAFCPASFDSRDGS